MNYKENQKENKVEDISNRTMEIIRTFEAPVELLWKVLTPLNTQQFASGVTELNYAVI